MSRHDIRSIEAMLCEDDHRCVLVIGHCDNIDDDVCQFFELPVAIDPAFFVADEWVRAARADAWRPLYG